MELENTEGEGGDDGGSGNTCVDVDDVDSSCSTPYYSASSSPGRVGNPGYYYSAPTSPMHFVLSSYPVAAYDSCQEEFGGGQGSCEFEFSARFTTPGGATAVGSMISADELFLNGQIRPMKLSTHLQRPQVLSPLLDLEEEEAGEGDEEKEKKDVARGRASCLRSRSLHRRARSMSPLRTTSLQWTEEEEEGSGKHEGGGVNLGDCREDLKDKDEMQSAASASASSSRSNSSSSTSRNGRRWVFLKDFLYRSKSEGRGNGREKFWQSISFHQSKDKASFLPKEKCRDSSSLPKKQKQKQKNVAEGATAKKAAAAASAVTSSSKPTNGAGKRRMPPCERHYTANRAQAEEMRKRTFLPYRQGVLSCLGFSSRGYGAMNGLARTLNPVGSR